MSIVLPTLYSIDTLVLNNPVQQVALREPVHSGNLVPFSRRGLSGLLLTENGDDPEILLVPPHVKDPLASYQRVIALPIPSEAERVRTGVWRRHPLRTASLTGADSERIQQEVLRSWIGAFSYVAEDRTVDLPGLRPPQLGALHAIHAHWAVSDGVATIVMPTGTGKTDTMLSIMVTAGIPRLLVVVPTDVLRSQLAEKFISLGILKTKGCALLNAEARHPIVCALKHIPQDAEDVDEICRWSQVIVTTSQIAGACAGAVQERLAHHCPYLFIDEAHHSEARTWREFRSRFGHRRVVQFTATPFREDGRLLDGEIVFKYPLRKAQDDGYFKPIAFRSVREFNPNRKDEAIVSVAIEQLRRDQDRGHIVMARVDTTQRAKEVFGLYEPYTEFHPVELHTGLSSKERRENRRKIESGQARIIVCVNMLGEGFDLPELKIAAFHDIRKTLAVTLQLAGRFTRTRPDLGNATFIANTADIEVVSELRKLYSRDPDWNLLLPLLNDSVVGEQQSMREFLQGFSAFAPEIPLKTVRPATSMVVYRTKCEDWTPEEFQKGIHNASTCDRVEFTINQAEHTLVIVTVRRVGLDWTDVDALFSWQWELYVVVWSPEQKLLFINSSTNAGEFRALAQAVAGESVELLKGDVVFRAFAGVTRLRLQNVGLSEQLGRRIRYTGRMGPDVEEGVPEAQRRRATKSVLAGSGFEGGVAVTVGASKQGRIWAHQRESVDRLAAWCKHVGAKLLCSSIDPDQVLKGTLQARLVSERPATMPVGVDWPEDVYVTQERLWSIAFGDEVAHISTVDISVACPTLAGPLQFALSTETRRAVFELVLFEHDEIKDYRVELRGDEPVRIRRGETVLSATDFFSSNPPTFWFADGAVLEGSTYVPLRIAPLAYDRARIGVWDWTQVNIKKESQKATKEFDSIQAAVIRRLQEARRYNVIFDDDAAGEAADVVTLRLIGDLSSPERLEIEFYHCKYSTEDFPGARITDLYEVCGQAQKSIHWMATPETKSDLLTHLLRREDDRRAATLPSRFECGDGDLVETLREVSEFCPVTLAVFIVQPGLSQSKASPEQLQLLSVTENHLCETYNIPFGIVGSA